MNRYSSLFSLALLVLVVCGGLAFAATSNVAKFDCCYPGSPCCFPGSPCCEGVVDCCGVDSPCCFPGSPCCPADAFQNACCGGDQKCCNPAQACCAAGASCCEQKEVAACCASKTATRKGACCAGK